MHAAQLGSVSVATDGTSGNAQSTPGERYYPFGGERLSGATQTDLGFTGGRLNVDLGLVHLGARWYDSFMVLVQRSVCGSRLAVYDAL